jgi:branched-chain amino acid transport system permease protein
MIRKNTDPSVTLIASMGLYVIIVNLIAMFFGSDNKIVSSSVNILEVNGIIISTNQIIQLLVGTFVVVVFYFGIKLTKLDISLKAIADNDILGEIYGVNSKRVRSLIMIIGSIIAVIAGILTTIEIGIEPHSGMNVTLTAATVAILVTRLDVKYLILVSILLTLFQNTIEWFLNSQWKEGLTFLILLMVILYKTEGLVSYKLRKN